MKFQNENKLTKIGEAHRVDIELKRLYSIRILDSQNQEVFNSDFIQSFKIYRYSIEIINNPSRYSIEILKNQSNSLDFNRF